MALLRLTLAAVLLSAIGCGPHDTRPLPTDGGSGGGDASPPPTDGHVPPPPPADGGTAPGPCVDARRLWFEDFETTEYSRWSSGSYNTDWGPESRSCRENGFSSDQVRTGAYAHRSAIMCRSHTDVHRGYGGVEFDGDAPKPYHTNSGVGIDAPHGVVSTFWRWLDVPYSFGGGRWLSLFTVNTDCGWGERVVTLGLDQPSRVLNPAHTDSNTFEPDAPAFPLRQWVRITVYVNGHTGDMHVWQDGQSVVHSRFTRPTPDLCQFHWGAYASGDNDDVVLFEDDQSIWRLEAPWTDMRTEPYFDDGARSCE